MPNNLRIRKADAADVPVILELIRALAEFEKLSHECIATEEKLRNTLFSSTPAAEVILAELRDDDTSGASGSGAWKNAGFALFFTSYSNIWRRLLSIAVTEDSNGQCLTGTNAPGISTPASAPNPWMSGPFTASPTSLGPKRLNP